MTTYSDLRNDLRNDLHNTFSPKHHVPHFVPGYKNLFLNQKKTNKGLLITCGILAATTLLTFVGCDIRTKGLRAELEALRGQNKLSLNMINSYVDYSLQLETKIASMSAQIPKAKVSKGKVSYYSEEGCLGCNSELRMANGEIFKNTNFTLAHNSIPLNTWVTVKNLDNGLFVRAKVTDRGGFGKYNRIADLSLATAQAINAKTDKSIIEITWN